MKKISLRYNPFKAETRLYIDGNEAHLVCLGSGEGSHIEEWKNDFFPQLEKKINIGPGSACAVIFYGLEEDFAKLNELLKSYLQINQAIKIFFERCSTPLATLVQKQKECNALFETIFSNSPCEVFFNDDFKTNVAEIKSMPFPEYINEAEKLQKQINRLQDAVVSCNLKTTIENQLSQKNKERENIRAAIEERKRLESEENNSGMEEELRKAEEEHARLKSIHGKSLAEVLDKIKNEKTTIETLMDHTSGSVSACKSLNRILSNNLRDQIALYSKQFETADSGSTKKNITINFSPSVDVIAMSSKSAKSVFDNIFSEAEKAACEYSQNVLNAFSGNISEKIQTLRTSVAQEKERRQKELELGALANDESLSQLNMETAGLERQLAWINDFMAKTNTILDVEEIINGDNI
jgi:hypothetical protein